MVLEELEKGTSLLVFREVVERALCDMVVVKLSSKLMNLKKDFSYVSQSEMI